MIEVNNKIDAMFLSKHTPGFYLKQLKKAYKEMNYYDEINSRSKNILMAYAHANKLDIKKYEYDLFKLLERNIELKQFINIYNVYNTDNYMYCTLVQYVKNYQKYLKLRSEYNYLYKRVAKEYPEDIKSLVL